MLRHRKPPELSLSDRSHDFRSPHFGCIQTHWTSKPNHHPNPNKHLSILGLCLALVQAHASPAPGWPRNGSPKFTSHWVRAAWFVRKQGIPQNWIELAFDWRKWCWNWKWIGFCGAFLQGTCQLHTSLQSTTSMLPPAPRWGKGASTWGWNLGPLKSGPRTISVRNPESPDLRLSEKVGGHVNTALSSRFYLNST